MRVSGNGCTAGSGGRSNGELTPLTPLLLILSPSWTLLSIPMPTRTQHIGTITEMSSRYHNLQEQYHGLRNREPAPPPGGPVDVSTVLHGLKEMNRDLKKALDEARQRAVEAEARG